MNDIERDLRRRLKKSISKRTELNNKVLEYQKERQELIEYLKEKINQYTLPLQDKNAGALSYSLPIKGVYEEILSKIEKR